MPELNRLLEVFYLVDDVERAYHFYRDVLELRPMGEPDARGTAFILPGGQLLGLVGAQAALESNVVSNGEIPAVVEAETGAAPRPSGHLAFAISHSEIEAWRERLTQAGVVVTGEVEWERGGHSLYFRDPDGHLLELAAPGIWDFY